MTSTPTSSVPSSPVLTGNDPPTSPAPRSPTITGALVASAPVSDAQRLALPPPHLRSVLRQETPASSSNRTLPGASRPATEQDVHEMLAAATATTTRQTTTIQRLTHEATGNLQEIGRREHKVGQKVEQVGLIVDKAGRTADAISARLDEGIASLDRSIAILDDGNRRHKKKVEEIKARQEARRLERERANQDPNT